MVFKTMKSGDRALCVFYALFAALNTVLMSWLAIAYTLKHFENGFSGLFKDFLREATANDAAIFIYTDLVLVWFALSVYMVVEARRFGIRHVWAYIVGAPLLALNVSFPLFMLVRHLKKASLVQ